MPPMGWVSSNTKQTTIFPMREGRQKPSIRPIYTPIPVPLQLLLYTIEKKRSWQAESLILRTLELLAVLNRAWPLCLWVHNSELQIIDK